ncbi:MAG: peptidase M16 [Alphaproteobacteria bacterium PA2]|nr:MAG: peptidase M16 [Alphaproteobacteria bacterium PA2]
MPSPSPAASALVAALWFALSSSPAGAQPDSVVASGLTPAAVAETAYRAKPPAWPQLKSGLNPDPEVRFGSLPNGMRYVIRRQSARPGQAALRLRIEAGSLMESDAQQGLAHFLEHMAFKGSKAYPDGDMVRILERHGLAFGADTNASTDFDQTVYKLDLPRTDDDTVDTTLALLREAAGELTLDQAAMDSERGVVLSEERTRDTPYFRLFGSRLRFQLKDQRPGERFPIGKVDVLRTAPVSQIVDYYRKYYRPERTVLIAVGDFDPAAMEAKIRDRFSNWAPPGPAGKEPGLGKVKSRKLEARLMVDPGLATSIGVAWVRSPDLRPDTIATRREELLKQLGFTVLNRRLQAIARSPGSPFLSSGAFATTEYKAATITNLVVNADFGQWKAALTRAELERRRILQFGVRQDELDREIVELRTALKANAAGAATILPSDLADAFVASIGDDSVITSPAQDLAEFEAQVKGLKADTVSDTLRGQFKGEGPLIYVGSPKPIAGGESAIIEAFKAAEKEKVEPPKAIAEQTWPYTSFGNPTDVVETRDLSDLDVTFLRFANGVRLTVKPTKFQDDQILVRINMGEGRSGLPSDRPSLGWAAGAFTGGGLGKLTATDLEKVLASRVFGARFGISDDAFALAGETTPSDLEVQLQLLAAYVSNPGWRSETFGQLKTAARPMTNQFEATDSGVLSRDLAGLLHGGDPRWKFPQIGEIEGADFADFRAMLAPVLAEEPLEVVIVGDITVEKAVDLVSRTFGSLPNRKSGPSAGPSEAIRFPVPVSPPVQLTHKGREDQSIALMAWPVRTYFKDSRGNRAADILSEIMKLRLRAELRETQGATYAPNTSLQTSLTWPDWGYLAARVEVPVAKLGSSLAAMRKIAADLAQSPPSEDELARAKNPRLDDFAKARETNGYWVSELSGAQTDIRRLDILRGVIAATEKVSVADVQQAARDILNEGSAWTLTIVPEDARLQRK